MQLKPEYREALIEGMVAENEGRFKDMLMHAEALIAIDPENTIGYSLKGEAYIYLNRDKEALPLFDKSIALYPNMYRARLLRGKILFEFKNFAAALADFNFLIEHRQHLMETYVCRADIFLRQGQWHMALKDYEKAEKLGWKEEYASFFRGVAWFKVKDYTHALYFLDKAVRDIPGDFRIIFTRGKVHYALEHWKQCEMDMSHTLYLNKNEKMAYYYRANAKLAQGNTEGGEKDMKALYDIDPAMVERIAFKKPDPDAELFFFPDIN